MHPGPRPFYRSRLFWLGMVGAVFLVWAWWDSGERATQAKWSRGLREYAAGVAWIYATDLQPPGHVVVRPFTAERHELYEKHGRRGRHFDFAAAFERKTERAKMSAFGVDSQIDVSLLALWVVVSLYVVTWMAVMFAWQRRKMKLVKVLTEVEVAA